MNWLDNLIGFVSPKTAYKRQAYRNAIEASRAYDAANYKNANANWHASIESAEMGLSSSREIIRARARDLENNSDIMNSILGAYKRNVVGAGYRLRANTGKGNLDKDIESLWHEWTKAKNCDVTAVFEPTVKNGNYPEEGRRRNPVYQVPHRRWRYPVPVAGHRGRRA